MSQIRVENVFSNYMQNDYELSHSYAHFRNQLMIRLSLQVQQIKDKRFWLKLFKQNFLLQCLSSDDLLIQYKDQFIKDLNDVKVDVFQNSFGKRFAAEFPISDESQLHFVMNKLTTALMQNTLQGACIILFCKNNSSYNNAPFYEHIKDYLSIYQSYQFDHPAQLDLIVIQKSI